MQPRQGGQPPKRRRPAKFYGDRHFREELRRREYERLPRGAPLPDDYVPLDDEEDPRADYRPPPAHDPEWSWGVVGFYLVLGAWFLWLFYNPTNALLALGATVVLGLFFAILANPLGFLILLVAAAVALVVLGYLGFLLLLVVASF